MGTLIFMALATFVGREELGSKNWVMVGGLSFQPSEFGKIFFIAYLAAALKDYKNFKQLIEPAIVVMVSLGFMVLQNDFGSALLFFAIAITMLIYYNIKVKIYISLFGIFCNWWLYKL